MKIYMEIRGLNFAGHLQAPSLQHPPIPAPEYYVTMN